MVQKLSDQQKGSLLAFIGVFLITPDSLLIRLSNIETWGMLFYRGAIPFVVVLIGTLVFYNKNFLKKLFGIGYPGIFYIFSFSACNITFILSIQNTNVANTLVMIALAPMLSAILGAIFLKEAPDKKTWVAILITFAACVYIFYDSLNLGNFLGDFFGFYPHNDSVYFIIADVAGKGVHAGMVMAKASTLFEIMSRDKVDPDEMIYHMNNDLFLTKTGGMFVTSILGYYNTINDEIRWVNGGHQPALLRDNNGNYEQIESKSPPMGVITQKNKSNYAINKTKLNGKRFYAFTDGLSESLNSNGEEIGIDGSIKIIEKNFNKDISKQLSNIAKDVEKTSGEKKLSDDLTIIAIGK